MIDIWKEVRDETCTRCDLHKSAQAVCLLGSGPVPCRYMFIGEAPGKREDNLRKVFQHTAGRNLDRYLRLVGLTRDDIYLTNANKCRPPENRTPTMKEIRACREYILNEIELVEPEVIICLGAPALKAIMNDARASIKKYRMKDVIESEEFPGIKIYSTYHPAAEVYDPNIPSLMEDDFKRIFGMERNLITANREYTLLQDPEETWEVLKSMRGEMVALDFETTGLDPLAEDFKLLTVGLCKEEGKAYCIPLDHPESPFEDYEWAPMLEFMIKWFEIIGHNVKYELKCMLSQSFPIPDEIHDTMVLFHLLDENYPSKSLHTLKKRFTDLGEFEDGMVDDKSRMVEVPLIDVAKYNCEDVDATLRLFNKFYDEAEEQGLHPLYYMQMDAIKMLAEVELTGLRIDIDLLDKNVKLFHKRMEEIQDKYPFNLKSDQQLSKYLYDDLEMRILEETTGGQGSVAADVLRELKNTVRGRNYRDQLDDILTFKKLAHFDSHFLTGVSKRLKGEYIYPQYNLTKHEGEKGKDVGTVTGRLSASLIHQVPRDTEELENIFGDETIQIKEMFISRFNGGWITQADYSQGELRLLAEYAQDDVMIEDFESGEDIHTAVTNRLIPVASKFYVRWTEFKAKRKATKAVNFGIIYGISEFALAERLGVPQHEARNLIRDWFSTYRGVKRWLVRMEKMIVKRKEVKSLIGRVRRLPGADSGTSQGRRAIRQGINSPIQGLLSDINVLSMTRLRKELMERNLKSKLIATVHDSILLDTHPSEKDTIAKLVDDICTDPDLDDFSVKLRVPLPVDIVQKHTWSSKGED